MDATSTIPEEDFVAYEKWCEENHRIPWCYEVDPHPDNVPSSGQSEHCCWIIGVTMLMIHIRQAPYEWQKRYIDNWKKGMLV